MDIAPYPTMLGLNTHAHASADEGTGRRRIRAHGRTGTRIEHHSPPTLHTRTRKYVTQTNTTFIERVRRTFDIQGHRSTTTMGIRGSSRSHKSSTRTRTIETMATTSVTKTTLEASRQLIDHPHQPHQSHQQHNNHNTYHGTF
eukprot:scaffold202830_cov34-Attheya_sp.AAC.1